MSSTLQAIPTEYAGYRFRSRTEARWAVFFDHLGIPFEYEAEGFELPSGWYLPDFWLPQLHCWVEIKPAKQYRYRASVDGFETGVAVPYVETCRTLAERSGLAVWAIGGSPGVGSYAASLYDGRSLVGRQPFVFGQGRKDEHEIWMCSSDFQFALTTCGCCRDEKCPLDHGPRIAAAYQAARSARFEHGESPR